MKQHRVYQFHEPHTPLPPLEWATCLFAADTYLAFAAALVVVVNTHQTLVLILQTFDRANTQPSLRGSASAGVPHL